MHDNEPERSKQQVAESSLTGILDNIAQVNEAVSRYCKILANKSDTPERIEWLRVFTERIARHWADGVRLTIAGIDFHGMPIDPKLRAVAMKLVEQCEAIELE